MVCVDFRSIKRVVEDENRSMGNQRLNNGYTLIEEVNTRFGTHYKVSEIFLKSATRVLSILRGRNRPIANTACEGMKKTPDADGNITGFPTIEAMYDGLRIDMECVEPFKVSIRPTIRIARPLLFQALKNLFDIGNGGKV